MRKYKTFSSIGETETKSLSPSTFNISSQSTNNESEFFIKAGEEDEQTLSQNIRWKIIFISLILFISMGTTSFYKLYYKSLQDKKTSSNVKRRPNFVFILADDMSFASIRSPTNEAYAAVMPELTSLARQGIYMNNFYSQEVCTPARAALLTGRYPISNGVQYGIDSLGKNWGLNVSEILLPQVLGQYGYKSYAYGKWHLGYIDPAYLPTARGFTEYIGYLLGQEMYWSKHDTSVVEDIDFLYSNETCYSIYNQSDKNELSTYFYTNRALEVIERHSSNNAPFFIYLPFQNVHSPFTDIGQFSNYSLSDYVPSDILSKIKSKFSYTVKLSYLESLYLLDEGVKRIRMKLEETGQMDNTYIIFQSDNGGCYFQGGSVENYRGTKGSLFEGGTKVDSFIYSPMIRAKGLDGFTYDNLMHTTDWFPTILSLAGISYKEDHQHKLDGVSHADAWSNSNLNPPRSTLVYNIYVDVKGYDLDIWVNASCAIRNSRYKLIHANNDSSHSAWYPLTATYAESTSECNQETFSGDFVYWLFDLLDDPYEKVNIYNSSLPEHIAAKSELYESLFDYTGKAQTCYIESGNPESKITNEILSAYVFPYYTLDEEALKYCPS